MRLWLLLYMLLFTNILSGQSVEGFSFANGGGITTGQENVIFATFGQNVVGTASNGLQTVDFGFISRFGATPTFAKSINNTNYQLGDNYPNPFNNQTSIPVFLSENANIRLVLYNGFGEKVMEIFNGNLNAGKQEIIFSAEKVPTGIYFYKLYTNNFSETKTLVVKK